MRDIVDQMKKELEDYKTKWRQQINALDRVYAEYRSIGEPSNAIRAGEGERPQGGAATTGTNTTAEPSTGATSSTSDPQPPQGEPDPVSDETIAAQAVEAASSSNGGVKPKKKKKKQVKRCNKKPYYYR